MDPERSGSFSGGVFLCPKEARGVLTGSKTFKEKCTKLLKLLFLSECTKITRLLE